MIMHNPVDFEWRFLGRWGFQKTILAPLKIIWKMSSREPDLSLQNAPQSLPKEAKHPDGIFNVVAEGKWDWPTVVE
jgi:hypothetical protein